MKGIDKRTHKDGTVSYRARVRIKGHPVLIQSFASKTLAMKWKRDTESAVEQGKYEYDQTWQQKYFSGTDRSLYRKSSSVKTKKCKKRPPTSSLVETGTWSIAFFPISNQASSHKNGMNCFQD